MATGSITKFVAEDGRVSWRVRADGGTDPATGKRRQRMKTFPTKKEAESWAREQQRMADRGEWGTAGKITLGEYIAEWLHGAGERGRRPSTLRIYDQLLTGRVVPALGHVQLAKLAPAALEKFFREQERELKPASVRTIYAVLRVCLADAVRLGALQVNPLGRVKAPSVPPSAKTAWTPQDARAFLVATEGHSDHALYLLLLACGLRIGEGLALRWADVDLEAGSIRVCRTLTADRAGRAVIGERTKGGKDRTVPCAPMLVDALRAHRQRQREARMAHADLWRDSGLVFVDTIGERLGTYGVRQRLRDACEAAGVLPLTPHGLRHTTASVLAQYASVAVARDVLGHSSLTITNGYVHTSDAARRVAGPRRPAEGRMTRVCAIPVQFRADPVPYPSGR